MRAKWDCLGLANKWNPTPHPKAGMAFDVVRHWEGVYLLAKNGQGRYSFASLDEKLGPDVTLGEVLGRR